MPYGSVKYIANPEGYKSVQAFWRKVKEPEKENIVELTKLLSEHIRLGPVRSGLGFTQIS